jgi:hypothetical protein
VLSTRTFPREQYLTNINSSYSNSGTTLTTITSIAVTTHGGIINLGLTTDGTGVGRLEIATGDGSIPRADFQWIRTATIIAWDEWLADDGSGAPTFYLPASILSTVDRPSPGSYTYYLKGQPQTAATLLRGFNLRMVLTERW